MARLNCWVLLVLTLAGLLSAKALGQGETTSAIVGEVSDATSAVVPGARVTITNHETGLKRNAKTDGEGQVQLSPTNARHLFGQSRGARLRSAAE